MALKPDEHQSSLWNLYTGTVSVDKDMDQVEIKVICPELMPALQGTISADTTSNDISLTDMDGNSIQSNITSTNSITAVWYGESNRKYPPDVYKGEQVEILKYGNSDRYYWRSLGRDMRYRKLETLRWEVSNDKSANKQLTDNNTYFLELDTLRNPRIIMRTSNSNGEQHIYQFLIDTKNSVITLCDEINNEIRIESNTPRVRLRNSAGTFLDLFNQDAVLAAVGNVFIKADKSITFSSPDITTLGNNSVTTKTATLTDQVSGNATLKASSVNIGGSTTIDGKPFLPHTHPTPTGQSGGVS